MIQDRFAASTYFCYHSSFKSATVKKQLSFSWSYKNMLHGFFNYSRRAAKLTYKNLHSSCDPEIFGLVK